MTASQRERVSATAVVVDAESSMHGVLAKPVGPSVLPADVMVLLDADVLVVRHLGPLIATAKAGKLVFFENNLSDRFFPEWTCLGLGAPKEAPYVIAGHFLGSRGAILPLLRELKGLQDRLPPGGAHFDGGRITDPFFFADQDIINAYLMTVVDPESIVRLPGTMAPVPPFKGFRRGAGVSCIGPDGTEPYFLHHILRKPWLAPTTDNLYARLLRNLLWSPNAPVALEPCEVPLRLRPSPFAGVDRGRASAIATVGSVARGEHAIGRRLAGRVRRLGRGVGSPPSLDPPQ
jgi:hypothetical protein